MFQAPFVNIIDPSATRLRAVDFGFVYIGKKDTDATLPENQIPLVYIDENGTTQQLAQPVKLNATGVPVLSTSSGVVINPIFHYGVVSIVIQYKTGKTCYEDKNYPALSETLTYIFNSEGYTYSGQWMPGVQIPAKADRVDNYALWEPTSARIVVPINDSAFTTSATYDADVIAGNFRTINDEKVNLKDFYIAGDATASGAFARAISYMNKLSTTTTFPYLTPSLELPDGLITIDEPIFSERPFRLNGTNTEIKAVAGFKSVTVTEDEGPITFKPMVCIASPGDEVKWSSCLPRGIVLNCDDKAETGVYIRNISYANINCEIQSAYKDAVIVGKNCWGINLDNLIVENCTQQCVRFKKHSAANGASINNVKFWGEFKESQGGLYFDFAALCHGVEISGGFIEKVGACITVLGDNGEFNVSGMDFEYGMQNVIIANGVGGKPPVIKVNSSFAHSVNSAKFAAYNGAKILTDGVELYGDSDDLATDNLSLVTLKNPIKQTAIKVAAGSNYTTSGESAESSFNRIIRVNGVSGETKTIHQQECSAGFDGLISHRDLSSSKRQVDNSLSAFKEVSVTPLTNAGTNGPSTGLFYSGGVIESSVVPIVDNWTSLGSGSNRFKDFHVVNPVNVTSDARVKTEVKSIPQELIDFVLSTEIKKYKMTDGIRTHYGIIVDKKLLDSIEQLCVLDNFGPLCHTVFEEDVEIHTVKLGDLWTVRYGEWHNIMLEGMRRKILSL